MRFDTIIIGGGLAGLTAGIILQEGGRRSAIISSGQSALHFFSGSFESLDNCPEAEGLLSRAGIKVHSLPGAEILLPGGSFRPATLSLEDVALMNSWGHKALIVSFSGYHDFFPELMEKALRGKGLETRFVNLEPEGIAALRKSPSEMRSVNIARVADAHYADIAEKIKSLMVDEDLVVLPQVFGLDDDSIPGKVRVALRPATTVFIGTLPPSVPGIRTQMQLRRRYEKLGGTFILGDTVVSAAIHDGIVSSIASKNLDTYRLFADNFILCTGSFFSKGLRSGPESVEEAVMGLDTSFPAERAGWYNPDFFGDQPYMDAGVKTDKDLHPYIQGTKIMNLLVAGSLLDSSQDSMYGSGAGKAVRTAMAAANKILSL